MDYSHFVFLYLFLVWFFCHFLLSFAFKNFTAYCKEKTRMDHERRALRRYLICFLIGMAGLIAVTLLITLLNALVRYYYASVTGIFIALLSATHSLEEKGAQYYQRLSVKYHGGEKEGVDCTGFWLLVGALAVWLVVLAVACCFKFGVF